MSTFLKKSPLWTRLIDPFQPTKAHAAPDYQYTADARSWLVPLGIGGALLVLSLVGWVVDPHRFFAAYLVGWFFCLTIALGSLFFVIIQHLTKARWSVVVRRVAEATAWSFPLLALLSIPVFFGMHDLYHWTHEELYVAGTPEYDALLAGKRAYLNLPFWTLRVAFYLVIWSVIAYKLYALSVLQDVDPDPTIPARQRQVSAWGLAVTAVTTAFASYDLIMSVDPHWFSTIFGVYIFGGAFWTAHAFIAFLCLSFQRSGGQLKGVVTKEHYQDLGKMMFGFTVFWAYIAFSQYMLIWYGNIPEETIWYRHRLEHGWGYHSAVLLVAHFIIPFFILLSRGAKRTLPLLGIMTVYFFIMQWFDLHWLVMPALYADHAGFSWLDFTCWLGLFGLFAGAIIWRLSRHSLVPRNDPYLPASLHFENV